MRIELPIASLPPPVSTAQAAPAGAAGARFGDMVARQLQQVNQMVHQTDAVTESFATGTDVDLHRVMMAAEEAKLAMDFTLSVRNKLIDAYQEVMRLQM
jgi:flagellar hook-basal body complex protein FliE